MCAARNEFAMSSVMAELRCVKYEQRLPRCGACSRRASREAVNRQSFASLVRAYKSQGLMAFICDVLKTSARAVRAPALIQELLGITYASNYLGIRQRSTFELAIASDQNVAAIVIEGLKLKYRDHRTAQLSRRL